MCPKHNRRLVDPMYEEELGFVFFIFYFFFIYIYWVESGSRKLRFFFQIRIRSKRSLYMKPIISYKKVRFCLGRIRIFYVGFGSGHSGPGSATLHNLLISARFLRQTAGWFPSLFLSRKGRLFVFILPVLTQLQKDIWSSVVRAFTISLNV